MQTMQKDLRAALVAAVLLAFSLTASASEDAPAAWLSGTIAGTIGDDKSRWLYSAEAHTRYFDIGSGINQWLVRPAVGYALTNDMRAWVGYSRYRFRNRAGDVADENRYWQELDWKVAVVAGGNLSLRTRLEQRDIDSSRETQHVARFRARYARPLADGVAQTLVLAAESFFDLNSTDWGGGSGIAQYRLYAGLQWGLGSRTTLETGYLHQHIEVESQIDRVNHVGVLAFKVRLP